MKSLRNTDLTEVAGYFLFKNLKDFINETLLDSEEMKMKNYLINIWINMIFFNIGKIKKIMN